MIYLSCSLCKSKPHSTGNSNVPSGTFFKTKVNISIASCNNNNSLTVKKVEYKTTSASTWTLGDDTITSNVWTSPYGSGTIDQTLAYNVRYTFTDALGNTATLSSTVSAVIGIGIGLKNDRLRLGGLPTKPGLQVDWDAEFNGDTTFSGNVIFTGNVDIGDEYGSNANGSYQKFANGTLICWKYVTLNSVAMTTSWGNIYESSAVSLGNWPETFIDIPTISLIQDFTGSGAGMVEAVKNTSTTFVGNAYFWRATSSTLTLKYRIVGIGRWK